MGIENKRKAEQDGGPGAKMRRDGNGKLCPAAQSILDQKVADGSFTMVMLDDKVLSHLTALSPPDQENVLHQFFRTEIPSMKNPSAYLSGIIRSSRSTQGSSHNMNAGRMSRSPVSRQLEQMYRQGVLKPGDLDDKLMQRMMEEPEDLVLLALSLFEQDLPEQCRNRSAFFTSRLKIAAQRLSEGGFNGGPGCNFGSPGRQMRGGPGGPPMRGGPPPMGGGPGGPPPGPVPYGPDGFDGPGMMPPGHPGFSPPQGPARGPMGPPNGRDSRGGGPGRPMGREPGPGAGPGRGPPNMNTGRMGGSDSGGLVKDYTTEQIREGVRVDEFHSCSDYARFVAPYAAKELQNQFDAGFALVDILDPHAWRMLAALRPGEALDIVQEIGECMKTTEIRNPNAFFTSSVKKINPDIVSRARDFADAVARGDVAPPTPAQGPMGAGPIAGGGPQNAPMLGGPGPGGAAGGRPMPGPPGPGGQPPMPQRGGMPQQDAQLGYDSGRGPGGPPVLAMNSAAAAGGPGGGMPGASPNVVIVQQQPGNPGMGSAPMMHAAQGGQQGAQQGGMHMSMAMSNNMQGRMVGAAPQNPGPPNNMGAMQMPGQNGAQQGGMQGYSGGPPGGMAPNNIGMVGGVQDAGNKAPGYQHQQQQDYPRNAGPNMMAGSFGKQQVPQQQQQLFQQPPQAPSGQHQGMMQHQGGGYAGDGAGNMQHAGGTDAGGPGYGAMQNMQAQQSYDAGSNGPVQFGNPNAQYDGRNPQFGSSNANTNNGQQYNTSNYSQYSQTPASGPTQFGNAGQGGPGGYQSGPARSGPAPNARGVQDSNMYGGQQMQTQGAPGVSRPPQGGAMYSNNTQQPNRPPVNAQPPTLSQQVQNRIKQLVANSAGAVRFEHFDSTVCAALAKLAVPTAISCINSIEKADKRGVPSLQAFLMTSIQQYA